MNCICNVKEIKVDGKVWKCKTVGKIKQGKNGELVELALVEDEMIKEVHEVPLYWPTKKLYSSGHSYLIMK